MGRSRIRSKVGADWVELGLFERCWFLPVVVKKILIEVWLVLKVVTESVSYTHLTLPTKA